MSRTTYERLKAFCEANNISMSQLVETRVNDFLGEGASGVTMPTPSRPVAPAPRPVPSAPPAVPRSTPTNETRSALASPSPSQSQSTVVPMTSAAARYAIEPPPPIIKPKQQEPAPKPAEKRPDQIFTF